MRRYLSSSTEHLCSCRRKRDSRPPEQWSRQASPARTHSGCKAAGVVSLLILRSRSPGWGRPRLCPLAGQERKQIFELLRGEALVIVRGHQTPGLDIDAAQPGAVE